MAAKNPKTPTSYALSDESKELLRLISIADRRSMAMELEWFISNRATELGITIPADWVPPPPKPKKPKK